MRRLLVVTLMLFCASLFVAAASIGGGGGDRDRSRDGRGHKLQALVYHETTGFRHPSIPYAIEQLTLWGAANGFEVTADQTSARFTDRGLRKYDVVVWLSTVGGVRGDAPLLTDAEWAAFQRYIRRGGGYAGIHAASDCCDESTWYGELLGNEARFDSHPGGVGGSPGCIGSRPREPNRIGQTGSCFQAVVVTGTAIIRRPSTSRRAGTSPTSSTTSRPTPQHGARVADAGRVLVQLPAAPVHPQLGQPDGCRPPDHVVSGLRGGARLVHGPRP